MKKFLGLFALLSVIVFTANGQLDTFDLASYKLPYIKRSQLDLNLNLSGSTSMSNFQNEGFDKSKLSSGGLNGPFGLTYKAYENSEKKQRNQQYHVGLIPDFYYSSSNGESRQKSAYLGFTVTASQVYRYYYRNSLFFEPDLQLSTAMSSGKYNNATTLSKRTHWEAEVSLELPLLMGKGRIEPVQDARLAVYILEDLYKEGRISKLPGQDEIIALASLISEVKNKRFFDYRIRKMEEIEKVDSFLQAGGYIARADVRYFTMLNDNWDNSAGPVRESGRRFSAGLVPNTYLGYSYNKLDYDTAVTDDITKNTTTIFGIKAMADYSVDIPIDLHWQKNWSVNVSYGYGANRYQHPGNGYQFDQSSFNLAGKAAYGLGYYPNSRTDVTAQLSLNMLQYILHESYSGGTDRYKYLEMAPDFSLNLHYYISPQMRLNAVYHVDYVFTNLDSKYEPSDRYFYYKTNTFNQSLNLGFLYSFF